ncbi:Stk1 family PASTA domain-containing Ser/Thr kinase [[Clostridium] fimetarium]|uniref:non-specific serine/threonine protein kinase n=1 Tax=[Clostridium] fimetarium TaxID=99656 RepID=A0A1I0MT85_9FIRM|nr:Stk1 family PASTA domain-containing Ser/Thr kinase [[Clostridium] fimetarium]SEV91501.1 serine/threonine protein kinase [[Clostridium] fimetarium]
MLRKGMFLADRYEIIDQIGTGGMSDVYKAKCHKLNRFVAIKVLKQEFSQDKNFVSKFRIEAQSAAGLTHPNVVNVYDVGEENGIHYIVMELVEGITLKQYIEKKGKLSSKEAVSIAIQVAQGIEAAHRHHIIHRDIKPQNIIISKEGKVKVTDFGIARAATTNTITSSAMGSVHYISPEQARGGYSDERSDIYSFGITLYEMLTGKVPFDGDSTVAVAVQHIQDEIAPPSQVTEDIPISVDKIFEKCSQKKTERRYQNITDLIADLKKSLVMPNVDFVKMAPVYGDLKPLDVEAAGIKTDMINSSNGNEDDMELLGDEDDEDDDDFFKDEEDSDKSKDLIDDDEDIEDGSNEKLDKIMKWIGIGIVALIIIVAIFAVIKLAGAFGGGGTSPETTSAASTIAETSSVDSSSMVVVPKVEGLTEEQAKEKLNSFNIGYKAALQASETIPSGIVIQQSAVAGSKVALNATITLSISTGPNQATVPIVVKKTEDDAIAALKAAGLFWSIDRVWSETVDLGIVTDQSPKSGTIKAGDTVKLYISRGKETKDVTVPDVTGNNNVTESSARQTLDALGFKVVSKPTASQTVAIGNVISQDTSAGRTATAGSTITLAISTGVVVPRLTDMTLKDAKAALAKAGGNLTLTSATKDAKDTDLVTEQLPVAGESVSPGSQLSVTTKSTAATVAPVAPVTP